MDRTKSAAATPQLLLGMGGFRDRASSWPRCWGLDVSSDLQAGLAAPRAGDVYWRAVCTWCPIHSNHSEYMDCSVFSSTSRRPPNHVPAVPGIRAQRTMVPEQVAITKNIPYGSNTNRKPTMSNDGEKKSNEVAQRPVGLLPA